MNRMQYSDYKMEERVKVYQTAKRRYDDMVKRHTEGVEPFTGVKNGTEQNE